MDTHNFLPNYAAFGAGWTFDYFKKQIEILTAESKYPNGGFPFGFPGGKEAPEDEGDSLKTINREFIEECRKSPADLLGDTEPFFHRNRRNDFAGSGAPFRNVFTAFRVKDKETFQPESPEKDSVKEVKWRTLLEIERLPLKPDHRMAFIEFCYRLEESVDDKMKDIFQGLAYKMFYQPSTIGCMVRVRPEFQEKMGLIIPLEVLPKDAFLYVMAA